jgi:hypothetical protein
LADHPANGPDVIAVAGDQVGGGEVSIVIHNAGNSSRPFWSSPCSLRLGRERCRLYWAEPWNRRPGCDQRACRIAVALSHPRGISRSAVLGLESFHDRKVDQQSAADSQTRQAIATRPKLPADAFRMPVPACADLAGSEVGSIGNHSPA